MNDAEWKRYAKNFLKAELMRRDIGYEVLAEKLKDIGVDETYHSINTKINSVVLAITSPSRQSASNP